MKAKAAAALVTVLVILSLASCYPIAPATVPVTSQAASTSAILAAEPAAETATSAPSGAALQPPPVEVCNGMAHAVMQALSVEVSQSKEPVPFAAPATGASGTACRATATGTGEQFSSPDAVMKSIDAVLTGGGWVEDPQLAAGGPTGIGEGFRSGSIVCEAVASWTPDPAANCPTNQPISACKVTPAQQIYTITMDCAQSVPTGTAASESGATSAGQPNPASVFCEMNGGKLVIETAADGGEYGVCTFANGRQCEEWAMYRGECPIGGVAATPVPPSSAGAQTPAAIANPASQNCVAQGGQLKIEERGDGGQIGVCYLEGNRQCEEWALMRGECPVRGDEMGSCTFLNGAMCDAEDYFSGRCDPSSGPS